MISWIEITDHAEEKQNNAGHEDLRTNSNNCRKKLKFLIELNSHKWQDLPLDALVFEKSQHQSVFKLMDEIALP